MNHPVKRHKPNDEKKENTKNRNRRNLYEGHHQSTSLSASSSAAALTAISTMSALTENQIKTEPTSCSSSGGDDIPGHNENNIEPVDGDDSKILTESLYTSKGLQPSFNDLDQLFEEDNSGSSPLGVIKINTTSY